MTLQDVILLVIRASILLSVLALGLRAKVEEVTLLFRNPARMGRLFLAMHVIMPLVALGLCFTFDLPPAVKIALVTLSLSPVPPLFKNQALKGGGRADYVVATMAASAVMAVVFIPVAMALVSALVGIPMQMTPGSIAKLVAMTMLLPLLAGIAIHAYAPELATKISAPLARFAMLLLIVAALPLVVGAGKGMFALIGDGTLASMVAFVLIGVVTGDLLGGPGHGNRRITAIATTARHPAIAIAIAQTNFPNQKLAVPAVLLYMIVSAIVTGVYLKKRFPVAQTV